MTGFERVIQPWPGLQAFTASPGKQAAVKLRMIGVEDLPEVICSVLDEGNRRWGKHSFCYCRYLPSLFLSWTKMDLFLWDRETPLALCPQHSSERLLASQPSHEKFSELLNPLKRSKKMPLWNEDGAAVGWGGYIAHAYWKFAWQNYNGGLLEWCPFLIEKCFTFTLEPCRQVAE